MAYSYSIDDPAKNSKRTLAFILTVMIHVFFFWILASGLGAKMVQTVMGPVETKMIEELPDDDKEPPPPPPDIEQPPPYVPPPEVSIDLAIDTGPTTAISNATSERPVATPPPVAKPADMAQTKPASTAPATASPVANVPGTRPQGQGRLVRAGRLTYAAGGSGSGSLISNILSSH